MKIKEWKYNDMMKKACQYGDKWMEFNYFERDHEAFDTVKVIDGYVNYNGPFEVIKETAKAIQVSFNDAWTEWLPKSTVIA